MLCHTPDWWTSAKAHLSTIPNFQQLITRETPDLLIGGDAFTRLCRLITGQQLSTKASASIFAKLEASIDDINPLQIKTLSSQQIRLFGYSKRKTEYIQALAEAFLSNKWNNRWFVESDLSTVRKSLLNIRGIGEWTVQMFCIFYRGEPDELLLNDLGIVKAIEKIHFKSVPQNTRTLASVAECWRPYRSAACWYLWHYLDNSPN